MNHIYLYKNSIHNQEYIEEIVSKLKEDKVIEFENFNLLDIDSFSAEANVCLITLDQVRQLNKSNFNKVIQQVGTLRYVLLINPVQVNMIKRLMKTGTKSILLMDDSIEFIMDAIHKTIQYGGYLSPRIVSLINQENKMLVDLQYRLTDRQRLILQELLNGKSDKMIASSLFISYHTMKTHRKRLFKMFQVNSQGELFALLN